MWGVEARQAGRQAGSEAGARSSRASCGPLGHAAQYRFAACERTTHTPPPLPRHTLSSFYSYATQRLRERERARESECEQVWCEVWRVGEGDKSVSYSYSYVDAATTTTTTLLVKINGTAN